jgi:alpha/beta hydrolase fold
MTSEPIVGRVEVQSHKVTRLLFWGALLLVVIANALASCVQTSWGSVKVIGVKFPTQNGQWVVADLFRPLSATSKSPAPLVVVVPGFQRSKETQANIAIELARRGVVVIAIDPYAQGSSSSSISQRAATTEGYGMFSVVEYVANTDNLNYVDKSRIGVTGHSAGGNAALQGAAYFGAQAIKNNIPSKLHSIYISGYILTLTNKTLKNVRSNVGISYALYDEGAFRNELKNGDMRQAPEALRLVNSGLKSSESVEQIEIGHYYGEDSLRKLRVVHNEPLLHPFQPYSIEATTHQIEFFQRVFGLEKSLPADNQIWFWKELLSFIAMVSAFVLLVPLAQLLLAHIPYFGAIAHPIPPALARPQGAGQLLFWTIFFLSAAIACFSYIPLTEFSQKIFVEATGREQTWFFPQRMNNGVMMWAVGNGLVGFALFYLSYHFFGKKRGVNREAWGIATNLQELFRTAILAISLFLSFYMLLFVVYAFLHVDYRFLFLGVRVFQPSLLLLTPMYVPPFFIFFLSNSLRVNGAMRVEGVPEWRSMLLAGLGNSLGLIFILLVQYVTHARTGTVYWTDGWLYINLLFAVVPMMFVLPYFNRYFFRMTGRIYLGPMTTCLIFIMILLSNTVCYIPL